MFKLSTLTRILAVLLHAMLAAPVHAGGSAAAPAPPYMIDQARYFASPETEQAELALDTAAVAKFATTAPALAAPLLAYLRESEALLAQLQRHAAYLALRAARDIDDQPASAAALRCDAAVDRLRGAVATALRSLPAPVFDAARQAEPALARYAYLRSKAQRDLPHALVPEQQALLDTLGEPSGNALWTIYQQTLRSTPFATLHTADGERNVRSDARLLAQNPDRTIRQDARRQLWEGYAARAEIYASTLFAIVRLNDGMARLQHFADAPDRVYFERGLDRSDVSAAFAAVAAHADLLQRYQRLRAQHVTATTGIGDVHSWDLAAPAPGFVAPRLSFAETRAAALAALAPLGADYVAHFRQLLDPANQRMDVGVAQGRRTNGGFSLSAPGVPAALFVENYGAGLLNDSRVIVHEGGHAIHRQLMNEAGVSPFYTRGPNWMFEAFAILNQFLLYDHLYRSSHDPQVRQFYLEALLGDMSVQLFTSAEEGTLEQAIYDGVIAGTIRNAADLDALSLSIWSRYDIWPAQEPEFAHVWMSKGLMYQDPLYLVNYLYAGLLASRMLEMLEHDPNDFRQRYLALLRGGFQAPPDELLEQFFGRRVSQAELVEQAMRALQRRIDLLALEYRRSDAAAETVHLSR